MMTYRPSFATCLNPPLKPAVHFNFRDGYRKQRKKFKKQTNKQKVYCL